MYCMTPDELIFLQSLESWNISTAPIGCWHNWLDSYIIRKFRHPKSSRLYHSKHTSTLSEGIFRFGSRNGHTEGCQRWISSDIKMFLKPYLNRRCLSITAILFLYNIHPIEHATYFAATSWQARSLPPMMSTTLSRYSGTSACIGECDRIICFSGIYWKITLDHVPSETTFWDSVPLRQGSH